MTEERPEIQPMKDSELGRYVCVGQDCVMRSITIDDGGIWIKTGQQWSSAHRDCFERAQVRRRTVYTVHYRNMYATALTPEFHGRTCNYWYTVTCGATSHTAFTTKTGLLRWLAERGLSLAEDLPELPDEHGSHATTRVIGEYYSASHGEFSATEDEPYRMVAPADWFALKPAVITAEISNGAYTLALITEADGIRTVHTLNPNVRDRITADHAAMRALMA